MSEMVERVAKVLAQNYAAHPDHWRDHIAEARAAIEAMREPSLHMREQVPTWFVDFAKATGQAPGPAAREIWRNMIDAALPLDLNEPRG